MSRLIRSVGLPLLVNLLLIQITSTLAAIPPPPATYCNGNSPSSPAVLSASAGIIASSPLKYTTPGDSCGWLICPANKTAYDNVTIEFRFVQIGFTDTLSLYDGVNEQAPLLFTVNGMPTKAVQATTNGSCLLVTATFDLYGER